MYSLERDKKVKQNILKAHDKKSQPNTQCHDFLNQPNKVYGVDSLTANKEPLSSPWPSLTVAIILIDSSGVLSSFEGTSFANPNSSRALQPPEISLVSEPPQKALHENISLNLFTALHRGLNLKHTRLIKQGCVFQTCLLPTDPEHDISNPVWLDVEQINRLSPSVSILNPVRLAFRRP